jgi:hypothetical protein
MFTKFFTALRGCATVLAQAADVKSVLAQLDRGHLVQVPSLANPGQAYRYDPATGDLDLFHAQPYQIHALLRDGRSVATGWQLDFLASARHFLGDQTALLPAAPVPLLTVRVGAVSVHLQQKRRLT